MIVERVYTVTFVVEGTPEKARSFLHALDRELDAGTLQGAIGHDGMIKSVTLENTTLAEELEGRLSQAAIQASAALRELLEAYDATQEKGRSGSRMRANWESFEETLATARALVDGIPHPGMCTDPVRS